MNRHERRAAKARLKKKPLDKVTAIHEAGHAVARILTASELGYAPCDAVDYIECGPDRHLSHSRTHLLESQATTKGPMFSADIAENQQDYIKGNGGVLTYDDMVNIVAQAKAEGCDIKTWCQTKLAIIAAGPAAEAKYINKPIMEVFESVQCKYDKNDAIGHCLMAGLPKDSIDAMIEGVLATSAETVQHPEIWKAIEAVADMLPAVGRVEGRDVATVVQRAMDD